MAIITEIRNRSALLIGVIGVAMVLFVAGDLLSSGQSLFVQRETDVAEIGGEKISYLEFENRIREQIGDQNVDQATREGIRQRVWNQFLQERVLGKQYQKLGIHVSPEELFYQIKNTQPNSILYQYFTNPETGTIYDQFQNPATGGLNTDMVLAYANQLISSDQSQNWLPIEKAIKQDRVQTKYNKLIEKGVYFTSSELNNAKNEKNTFLTASYVSMYYNEIPDKDVEITDADLKKYYNENKNDLQFQQEEATSAISYVEFLIVPSDEDLAALNENMQELKRSFEKETDDSLFVTRNSDVSNTIAYFNQSTLPIYVNKSVFDDTIGFVYGPQKENNFFVLSKKIGEKSAPDSVRARHILIAINEGDTATAMNKADSLKKVISRNKNFAELATEFSEDLGSAQKGGDLDWFVEGTMVKPFNDACFNGKKGDMPIVVSQFGVHLIEITDQTAPTKKVLLAQVKRDILPSKATSDKIYNEASAFSIQNNTKEKFEAATMEMKVEKANFIKENDKRINSLENAREIVRWTFENKVGQVSESFELDDRFVVALITEKRPEGTLPFENVKDQIRALVLRDKKAEIIKEKMAGSSDLNALASNIGKSVNTITELQFSSFSIQGVGPEYKLLGKSFSLPIGQISEPIVDNLGVYVMRIDNSSDRGQFTNNDQIKTELTRDLTAKVNFQVFESLKEQSNIKDNRAKFY